MRGFILQPTYRVERGRTLLHLYGKLENGDSFLLRDNRHPPSFFIEARHTERAAKLGASRIEDTQQRTMDGAEVVRLVVNTPQDAPALRDRLQQHGIATYEADVRYATRYLIQHGIKGSLNIDGPSRRGPAGIGRVYDNPQISPLRWTPELSVLSIDIETDPSARQLLSVALCGCGAEEVLMHNPDGKPLPDKATGYRNTRALLRAMCQRVRELDPDVITGWNVIDFDLAVLSRLAGGNLPLGRGPGNLRLRPSRGPWNQQEATIPGRLVLDGIQLLRGAYLRMDRYSLEHVARSVLGEGKILHGTDRAGQILDAFHHDRQQFVDYNLKDARLVLDILGRLRLVELSVERSLLTGLPPDRVAGAIAAFDFLYLSELGKRGMVAPSVGSSTAGGDAGLGGEVLEPEPGLFHNVLVFDFKSLYPSVIRSFHIDPLGYSKGEHSEPDLLVAPNGARFRRQAGILPGLLDQLFPRREEAKAAGDKVASHAIKILMNSCYGVLGTSACRFYRPALAGAITAFGREILRWSKSQFEAYGHRVLYGDTDSLFVAAGVDDPQQAMDLGRHLAQRLNGDLTQHLAQTWQVESRLELELERLYLRLLLPSMRHRSGGARKRYVGLAQAEPQPKVVFTGMEAVRRDWTELAKQVQSELYRRLFADLPVEDYLRNAVRELRAGEMDELMVYRKRLRKPLAQYTATTPPHVAAARKLADPPRRSISYVMTVAGPEPVQNWTSPIDHEHYVQKQIRPVAEPVLGVLGLNFDRVVGDQVQLELF